MEVFEIVSPISNTSSTCLFATVSPRRVRKCHIYLVNTEKNKSFFTTTTTSTTRASWRHHQTNKELLPTPYHFWKVQWRNIRITERLNHCTIAF